MKDILTAAEFEYHLTDVEVAGVGERNPSIRVLYLHDETTRMVLDRLVRAAERACDVVDNADEHVHPATAAYALKATAISELREALRLVRAHR